RSANRGTPDRFLEFQRGHLCGVCSKSFDMCSSRDTAKLFEDCYFCGSNIRGSPKKRFAISLSALSLLIAGPAVAADMRAPAPRGPVAQPVAVYNWTGCYVG